LFVAYRRSLPWSVGNSFNQSLRRIPTYGIKDA
jgi:hypothetical protein